MFLDEAVVLFRSGAGGDGAATFHREKFVPRGGPNGADGGHGGNVVLIADRHQRTLYDVKLKRAFKAPDGTPARGNKHGTDGADVEVRLPVGTVVCDADKGDAIVDLNVDGMRYVVCRGGKGGAGNLHYTNSVRQAPTFAQRGAPRESMNAKLELKLLADVGLVGMPNAGKSTLLSRLTAAKPKIADYPFTTIVPNLGVVSTQGTSFVMADLPGLIEGASEGHGLGHQFLKHVERTKVLVHVVDAYPLDGSDPVENIERIEKELGLYSERLTQRPRLLALNKLDLAPLGDPSEVVQRVKALGRPVFPISGVSGEGLDVLLYEIVASLQRLEDEEAEVIVAPTLRARDDGSWDVVAEEEGFAVVGARIERMVAMTDLGNNEAVRYLHRRLERIGVIGKLRQAGVSEGDNVRIGPWAFTYTERA